MEFSQCINFLLTSAQHKVFQEVSTRLAPYDVTPVQYGVLLCLWQNECKTPKEIAGKLQLENSTISGILERMEKKGLIQRQVSPADRRFVEIVLTEKGAELKEPILAIVDKTNEDVLAQMAPEQQEALKAALRTLAGIGIDY
ncbi:MAG: MarR family transcriptional regulator [Firmicutes bacterium]|nr:MarR family transcriptional regulator [Bacillota bacterium]